jgi:hypothetical protein
MEDEARSLPAGWIRQYDPESEHQFFVDTNVEPPRAIWWHPYDDPDYLNSLSSEERERIQTLHRVPTDHDMIAFESDIDDHTDDEGDRPAAPPRPSKDNQKFPAELPPRPGQSHAGASSSSNNNNLQVPKASLGRRMKDKLTGTTHEEREKIRAQRQKEEEELYRRHQMYRAAMRKAMETGEPQLIGKDKQGRDVYIEPPPAGYGTYGGTYGGGFGGAGVLGGGGGYPGSGFYGGGMGGNRVGYNPYAQGGPYANPNARYLRPAGPYSQRPYYGGYGGGLGLPIGMGLLGGALLGGAMF